MNLASILRRMLRLDLRPGLAGVAAAMAGLCLGTAPLRADETTHPVGTTLDGTSLSGFVNTGFEWTTAAGDPVIRSIAPDGTNLVVTVEVPAGVKRLTLEGRPRLGSGTWTPRAMEWLDGQAGRVTFRLPNGRAAEMLRVRGEDSRALPLPVEFYQGARSFAPALSTNDASRNTLPPGAVSFGTDATTTTAVGTVGGASATQLNRTVAESDIWRLDGSTLYFFNIQRGLQVIDLTQPDAPVLRGQLPIAAYGEQMYLLPAAEADGSRWLALLTSDPCDFNSAQVLVVRVRNGHPELVQRVPIPGGIRESRLVGDVLYVASSGWNEIFLPADPKNTPGTDALPPGTVGVVSVYWEVKTHLTSIPLENPAAPGPLHHVELAVSPDAISATDRFLFVATTGNTQPKPGATDPLPVWSTNGNHAVLVFDISDPAGAIEQRGVALTRGQVADKFKLNLRGDILTVASLEQPTWRWVQETPSAGHSVTTPARTWVETFSLANPAAPAALGTLKVIEGESLFATRFDGDRLYAVTFRRVDPLWIIDLSDPAAPTIRGELQIPGYSSYLAPLDGGRLLAMGVDGGRATVNLFNVADPAHPALLSKVFLGDNWSWSEANYDEKALGVFPEAGLLLVPWQGWSNNVAINAVQLVDLQSDTLVRRGVIDHAIPARRAAVLGSRLVSLSNRELFTVDATDRDHPAIKSVLPLAYQVDRVAVNGDRLVELAFEGPRDDLGRAAAVLKLAAVADPEKPLGLLTLSGQSVVGFELAGSRLHLLQHEPDSWRNEERVQTNEVVQLVRVPPRLEYRTNDVITEVYVPPLYRLETNWQIISLPLPPVRTEVAVTNVILLPPLPDSPPDAAPLFQTNIVLEWRDVLPPPQIVTQRFVTKIAIPQPQLLVTNEQVSVISLPQPPVLETNTVVVTNLFSIQVPGWLVASVVDCSGPAPVVQASLRLERPTNYWGAEFQALWPRPDLLVWADGSSGGWALPYVFPAYATDVAVGMPLTPTRGGFWWGPWSSGVLNLLALDVAQPVAPRLVSALQLGTGANSWNSVSTGFATGGRLHFTHAVSTPSTNTPADPAKGGFVLPGWYSIWETRHYLDVIDYADPAEPVVRDPVEVPGTLRGVIEGGALVYVRSDDATGSRLSALAYDGLHASLVDSLDVTGALDAAVRLDGAAFVARPPGTNTPPDPAVLEGWALGSDARWHRYSSRPLASPANGLHTFGADGELLIVSGMTGTEFFKLPGGTEAVSLGAALAQCNAWYDWSHAAASLATGAWIPRGQLGLWHVAPQTVPTSP